MPILLDDSELQRLAATPRSRLFQNFERLSAFAPLIVVCCLLPALQLLANLALNEEGALWGLRSLAVANATSFDDVLKPGLNETGEPLIYQPPLAAWLNGAVIAMIRPSNRLANSLVSLIATGIAIWITTRLAWRLGGANVALVSALIFCSHPLVFQRAIAPDYGALGICLILLSINGFQRLLEGVSPSRNLLISGFAWGLSLLAIGPVALIVPPILIFSAVTYKGLTPAPTDSASPVDDEQTNRSFLRSVLFVVIIGIVLSGWWQLMMLLRGGSVFLKSWMFSLPVECLAPKTGEWRCDLLPLLQPNWNIWLNNQLLLLPWLVIGLVQSWKEWRHPTNTLLKSRYQIVLLWWVIAATGRVMSEVLGRSFVSNTAVWDLVLICPTVLISAIGVKAIIERATSRSMEFVLIVSIVFVIATRLTSSWSMGLISSLLATLLLLVRPVLLRFSGREFKGWSQSGLRRLLQMTVSISLLACLGTGFERRCRNSEDENRLAVLRERLKLFPDVRRISLIATRDPVPITLRYLLRCRWPHASLGVTQGWDAGLTQAMAEEAQSPHSRFLILEWSQREDRLSADTGQAWQISAMGNPIKFHGRRLSMVLIEPRST